MGEQNEYTRQVNEELRNLTLLWNAHVTQYNDSSNPEPLHPIPAFFGFVQMQFSDTDHPVIDSLDELGQYLVRRFGISAMDEELSDFASNYIANVAAYAHHMFVFGQYCAMNGMLHANMTQCHCSQHDLNETLDEILKRSQ